MDEQHASPRVDLGVADLLEDGSLLIVGNVAGHAPRPLGQNRKGRDGPFVSIVGISFLNKLAGIEDSFSPDKPFQFITRNMAKARTPWHVRPHIPKLPGKLRDDLGAIPSSSDGDLTYWPCAARMNDGTVVVCVYVVPEGPYIRHWGIYPQQDRGKSYLSLSDVDTLAESPSGLPAQCEQTVRERRIWNGRHNLHGCVCRWVLPSHTLPATLPISFAIQRGRGRAMWLKSYPTWDETQNP
jgi:hypothetical protein